MWDLLKTCSQLFEKVTFLGMTFVTSHYITHNVQWLSWFMNKYTAFLISKLKSELKSHDPECVYDCHYSVVKNSGVFTSLSYETTTFMRANRGILMDLIRPGDKRMVSNFTYCKL